MQGTLKRERQHMQSSVSGSRFWVGESPKGTPASPLGNLSESLTPGAEHPSLFDVVLDGPLVESN